MFGEYTDPFDIDHYYDDVGKIFAKVADYVDPTVPKVIPELASPTPTAPPTVTNVSKFEVTPNTIFMDNHPVGSQPEYNILRSGPPKKESYHSRQCCEVDVKSMCTTNIYSIMCMILFVMFVYILYLQAQVRSGNMVLCMLMSEMLSKKK